MIPTIPFESFRIYRRCKRRLWFTMHHPTAKWEREFVLKRIDTLDRLVQWYVDTLLFCTERKKMEIIFEGSISHGRRSTRSCDQSSRSAICWQWNLSLLGSPGWTQWFYPWLPDWLSNDRKVDFFLLTEDSPRVIFFGISIVTEPGLSQPPISLLDPNQRNYLIGGLKPFTKYRVQVRARNIAGLSTSAAMIELVTNISLGNFTRFPIA